MRGLMWLLALAAVVVQPALADDLDALMLADSAPEMVKTSRDWQGYVETGFGESIARTGGAVTPNQRLSFDLQLDKSLAPGWRAVLADRWDVSWPAQGSEPSGINTLKEAYLSWQVQDERLLDLGRINARYGVATGYNPTDFLRTGALRSLVSVDPGSLKKNRMGSVMLRGQTLWSGGSLTALYSPRLADQPSTSAFSADLGATNNQHRWLLAASQQWTHQLSPQWLLFGGAGQSAQLGFNLTTLVGDAGVAFLEWSGGRSRSLWSQAINTAEGEAFHNRLATGFTYTTANKLTLTLEVDYNGAALDDAAWNNLAHGPVRVYQSYRTWVRYAQDMPSQQAAFVYAAWQDALVNHLDLNAMLRINLADQSRLTWLEARYHFKRADLALQWQVNSGSLGSEYGADPQQRAWQAVLRCYF
ncbi:MAG: hypothetical protein FD135_4985 [Comamonadaceae bacterium]|nr:MAG: hypothetical protein FD135_4985 [Comamonadaceae bacterium]